MKVKLTYHEPKEVILEMTPEEFCNLHADSRPYFPKNAINRDFDYAEEKDHQEFLTWLFNKERERKEKR